MVVEVAAQSVKLACEWFCLGQLLKYFLFGKWGTC